MRKYAAFLCIAILLGVISLQANQGAGTKNGPPWQETVVSAEYRHLSGEFVQAVYVPRAPGMYRVTVYASNETPEGGPLRCTVLFTDEYAVRASSELFNTAPTGSGTATVWSAARQPISVRVAGSGGGTYSAYVTVERF